MTEPAVHYSSPDTLFTPTGPWSVAATAGPALFLAGMRGIDPETNSLVDAPRERVRQIFRNIEAAARHSGFGLDSCVRLTVYVTDMAASRPLINEIQREFWDDGSFPPRTIVAVAGLNQDDFAEVEATFVRPGGT